MKKTILYLTKIIAGLSIVIMLANCNGDDEGAKYYKVSGTVSVSEGVLADGAIVTLSDAPNAANVIAKTVADASGVYSFMGVAGGTYYVNATYNPSNTNNMTKSAGAVILTGVEQEVSVNADATADIAMAGAVSGGNVTFDASEWTLDVTHSTVKFEFPYDGINSVFAGIFGNFGIDELVFDEANPTATSIKAWVDLTSIETGAPSPPGGHGRDGITGCIQRTFKVEKNAADTVSAYSPAGEEFTNWPDETLEDYDLWGNGSSTTSYQKQKAISGSTGAATFESTSVTPYGTGYAAKGDLTFAGVTKEVTLYFTYLEGYQKDNKGTLTDYVSFYGTFKFAADADFGVSSSHIGDSDVILKLSVQYNAPA